MRLRDSQCSFTMFTVFIMSQAMQARYEYDPSRSHMFNVYRKFDYIRERRRELDAEGLCHGVIEEVMEKESQDVEEASLVLHDGTVNV